MHLNKDAIPEDKLWVLDTPYDIWDEGMNDLLKDYQTNFAKGNDHKFDIKFKSKKSTKTQLWSMQNIEKKTDISIQNSLEKNL
jgi:hypothetical protein